MLQELKTVNASITILVDNTIMEFLPDSGFVKRLSRPHANFLAEHGFSALIETSKSKILLDTGATGIALKHNLSLLGLAMDDIDLIFLSHGHNDHTGGLPETTGKIIAHPDSFRSRFMVPNDKVRFDLSSPDISASGHDIKFERGPVELAEGVISTGEIKRIHKWEDLPIFTIKRDEGEEPDRVLDDQGVIINTPRGLVVVAGCSHAGIINTIEHAIELTGVSKVYAVIGGFHLIGPAEAKIDRTIQELKKFSIKKIVPIHCSGFEAQKKLSEEMPQEYEYCTTGCLINV